MFRLLKFNSFIPAFLFSLIGFSAFSNPAGVISVTAVQKQIPVLKGSTNNFVLEIDIEIKGNPTLATLNGVNLDISGTDIQNDIAEIAVFSRQHSNGAENLIPFGKQQKPQREMVFQSEKQLAAGINRFAVSVRLNQNAGILNSIKVFCKSLEIDNKLFYPENTNPPIYQRFGIALRKHNDEGVHTFRIPGLETTNKGTLIAVYDVRHNDEVDLQEDVDVGMSRSTDGGKTWEPMKIIMDMGEWGSLSNRENGVGDPCILVDRQTGTIWVAGLWAHGKPGQRTWNSSEPGLEPSETGQFLLVKSEDDGKTWSQPVNITQQVKNKNWQLMLQGPGKGITLKNGTLVFPAQFKDEKRVPFSTIIYSTDRGKSWKTGKGAKSETTEAQVIELSDGSLMLNMRDNRNGTEKSEKNGRAVMITTNLGETWTEHPTTNGVLPEPVCMASLIKEKFEVNGEMREVVFFSNPASKYNRDNMTIRASLDDGKTWPGEYQVILDEKEGRGYSCLTRIDDKTLGILYESSQADLVFQAIPVAEIFQQNKSASIFKSGTGGYSTFRIPAIVTTNSGKILAFAEGRVNGSSDTGNIDLVMKSSEDGGRTWSPLKIVWDDGENVCGNPAPVVDKETGTIHLLMTWNLGEDHEQQIIDGKSRDTRRIFVSSSTDDGKNWSVPTEITRSVKKENWTWYATGPCHGIQLENGKYKGRLVIPCDHIEAGTKKYFSHIIFSDDHGKTWKLGGSSPQDQVNECTVAELPDGRLILNMRNYDRSQKSRKISFSHDGGESWSDLQPVETLPEPICQASMLFSQADGRLYFLNPADENHRVKMTVKSSADSGLSWKTEKVFHPGPSAYSDLTLINRNTLGCLFEAGEKSPYEEIVFTTYQITNR